MVKIFEVCESSYCMKFKGQKSISTHLLTSCGKLHRRMVSFSCRTHWYQVDPDASKAVLSAEEFEAFLGGAVPNNSRQRVLPLRSSHEGSVPLKTFEQAINGRMPWKVMFLFLTKNLLQESMLRVYASGLINYIDESISTFQNLILEKKTMLFLKKDDIHDQVLLAWNLFVEKCKQRNQVINLGKCSRFHSFIPCACGLILLLAIHWSEHHPAHNLVDNHYYPYIHDMYGVVQKSL